MIGIPASGHQAQLTGTVVYAPADNSNGCAPINRNEVKGIPAEGLVIFLVERGNCTFVTKVQHAQDAGAHACVVIDVNNKSEKGLPYMGDDGHGATVSIPSFIIHKEDGDILSKALNDGAKVMLTLEWNVPHPDNIVEWSLWTTSVDKVASTFKRDFDEAARALGDSAVLTPHYTIANGIYIRCFQSDDKEALPCGDQCTNSGRYCADKELEYLARNVTGAQVVEENLRQICLFRTLKEVHGSTLKWWNYIENFEADCYSDFTKSCAEKVMRGDDVDVDPAVVQKCMDDSGGVAERGGENKLLEEEWNLQLDLSVWITPAVIINGRTYRGSLECKSPVDVTNCGVLAEMCLGFLDRSAISACNPSPGCPVGEVRDKCGVCGGNGEIDRCGKCLARDDPMFGVSCVGCDGVLNSLKVLDACG